MQDEQKQNDHQQDVDTGGTPSQSSANDQDAVAELTARCEEYLAGWKRAQADYQNAKREAERDRAEFAKYANERLLTDFLPAIDQFSLALRHVPDADALPEEHQKVWKNWLVGVQAVRSLWEQAATSAGLERVPTEGMFDPHLHDAAGEEAQEGAEDGSIVRVVQDGWRLYGKVLRPARVIVAKSSE